MHPHSRVRGARPRLSSNVSRTTVTTTANALIRRPVSCSECHSHFDRLHTCTVPASSTSSGDARRTSSLPRYIDDVTLTSETFQYSGVLHGQQGYAIGGQHVTIITDPAQITRWTNNRLVLFGLNDSAARWLQERINVPFKLDRAPTYKPSNSISPSCATAAHQHRIDCWPRTDARPDPTLALVRVNDARNAESWYSAAIDLTEMRDKLTCKGKGANRFLKKGEKSRMYYAPRALTGLYFKFMDVVTDGTLHGFRKPTNKRHGDRVHSQHCNPLMSAEERLEQALQAIRNEKSIIGDLLGPDGDGHLIEFTYHPRTYAEIKNNDRRQNGQRARAKETEQGELPTNSSSATTEVYPWSAQPVDQRSPCIYQAWADISSADRITTAAAARAYFRSAAHRDQPPPTPDPHLYFFRTHIDDFANILFSALVDVTALQDNPTGKHHREFVGRHTGPGDERRAEEMRNMKAWCYLVCERLINGAENGFTRPVMDGGPSTEVGRHGNEGLEKIFFGERTDQESLGVYTGTECDWRRRINVFQRFGAVHVALLCEKSIADPFRRCVEGFLRLRELLAEPLAYMESKRAHRRSNKNRQTRDKRPRDGDESDGENPRKRLIGDADLCSEKVDATSSKPDRSRGANRKRKPRSADAHSGRSEGNTRRPTRGSRGKRNGRKKTIKAANDEDDDTVSGIPQEHTHSVNQSLEVPGPSKEQASPSAVVTIKRSDSPGADEDLTATGSHETRSDAFVYMPDGPPAFTHQTSPQQEFGTPFATRSYDHPLSGSHMYNTCSDASSLYTHPLYHHIQSIPAQAYAGRDTADHGFCKATDDLFHSSDPYPSDSGAMESLCDESYSTSFSAQEQMCQEQPYSLMLSPIYLSAHGLPSASSPLGVEHIGASIVSSSDFGDFLTDAGRGSGSGCSCNSNSMQTTDWQQLFTQSPSSHPQHRTDCTRLLLAEPASVDTSLDIAWNDCTLSSDSTAPEEVLTGDYMTQDSMQTSSAQEPCTELVSEGTADIEIQTLEDMLGSEVPELYQEDIL